MLCFLRGSEPRWASISRGHPALFRRAAGALALLAGIVACGPDEKNEPAHGGAAGDGGAGGVPAAATFSVEYELASDVDPTAPTTVGIVTFSVDMAGIERAFIDFGLDDGYGMRAPVDLAEPGYRTLLLGMKPARDYHFRISAEDAEATYFSDDYVIQTGAPTTLVPLASFDVLDARAHQPGFILTSFWRGPGNTVPFILDGDGEIVWWYERGTAGIAHAAMSADGKNVWMVSGDNAGAPLKRVTMDTLDEQTYDDTLGSHDVAPVSGATMAYLDFGEPDCTSIFEIDPSGATSEIFESEGIVDPDIGPIGCHGNSIDYVPEEDAFTFSERDQDILLVSHEGEVLWRLAELVPGGNTAWGGAQHGHQLFSDSILLFANQANGVEHSGVFEYTREGEEIFRYIGPTYTRTMGDVQRLPGGNLLLVYSNQSLIHEVDPNENIVLEIHGEGSTFGYVHWTDSLYPAP